MRAGNVVGDRAQGPVGLALIGEAVLGRGDEIGPAVPGTYQPGAGAYSCPMLRGDAAGLGEGLSQGPKTPARGLAHAALRVCLEPVGEVPEQQVAAEPRRRSSMPAAPFAAQRGFGAWLLTLTSVGIVDRLVLWPRPAHDLRMKSRVHPKYKTTYRVGNWREYERALVQRGDVTLWLSADATDAWRPSPSGRPGGQKRFSDVAIETALILRLVFGLPLRQTEGFVRSVLALMGADLDAPDHTTLSRRSQPLAVMLRRIPATGPIHLIVDSTGLSIVGQGAWAAAKHGGHGKRGWKKLHLGVDRSGVIVAQALTDAHVDDATTAVNLIPAVDGDISSVTADAAYDTIAVYEAAGARGARVVVPPKRTAAVSRRRPRSVARDRTVKRMQEIGRRRWKKEAGYHRQARVENVFFRYKSIIGDGLRARSSAGQGTEAVLACNVLNRMTDLGRPASYAIKR